jgi:hypothetical protein
VGAENCSRSEKQKTAERRRWASNGATGFGWMKTEHLQVRTLGHFAFWTKFTTKKRGL